MSDWTEVHISELATIDIGGTPSRAIPAFWAEKPDGYPWISIADLKGKYVSDTKEHITALGVRSSNVKLIPERTAVMSFKLTVGRTAIAAADMYCNEAIAIFQPKDGRLDAGWLYHALPRAAGSVVTDTAVKGATLNKAKMAEMLLKLPLPAEQSIIARVLDTLDTAIHETEAIIAKLKAVKQGLLHDLLTRGIDANGELRPPQTEAPHLYKESPLGWIPQEWVVCNLAECAQISSGVTLGREVSGHGLVELPYLRVANVQDGYLDLNEVKTVQVLRSEIDRFALLDGDVLMNEGGDFDKLGRGTVWRAQIEPCLHQNHVFRVRCDAAKLVPDYLAAYSASQRGKAFFVQSSKQSTNLASINSTQLKAFPVVRPSVWEQREVVARLDASTKRLSSEELELQKLCSLKSGLMDDLLTGRVRVTPLLEGTTP